jgi:anti-sigma factor RsiW
MTDPFTSVSEDELHAYVDGELPADRREAVAAWLAAHPEEAARVAAWRAQAEGIRTRYGAVAEEPVPERLKLDYLARYARSNRRFWMGAVAATLAAFLIGGSAGWFARGAAASPPTAFGTLTADALEAHKLYVVEVRHPVEVPGAERAHMTKWLSKRLGHQLQVPDLSAMNLKLVGGRLLPGPGGASAFYMYESPSGERYTVYCAKAASPQSALRFKSEKQFAAVYWVENKLAYVVSGPDERTRLETVAKSVYDQIDKDTSNSKKS